MSKTPNYDAKIKAILDATKPGERVCELTGEKWDMTEEEISWYRKFNVPPSNIAPFTRMITHASFGTCFQWWYQKHPETGKQILTCIHPASGIHVLPDQEWYEKDFSNIFREINLQRPFFDLMYELERSVPIMATRNKEIPVNSISVLSLGDENDLLTFACKAKNSLFSIALMNGESSSEIEFGNYVINSYNCLHSDRIFDSFFIRDSADCLNSAFLFDCRNCEYCFGAVNKRNRKYLWWNEQLSKEEWEKRRSEVDFSCRSKLLNYQEQFKTFVEEKAIWPENFNRNSTDSIGEYLVKCLDCRFCYSCSSAPQHLYWCNFCYDATANCAFVDGATDATNCYYVGATLGSSDCKFCYTVIRSMNLEYCLFCQECSDCFGCVGLNHKRFHIFNKPYLEEEYWQKVDELKCLMLEHGEYGKFFPCSHSSSQFLESMEATMLGVGTKEIGEKIGANFFDIKTEGAVGSVDSSNSVSLEEVPDDLDRVSDDWIQRPVFDPTIGRRFAFFTQELDFYRKKRLALPNQHFILRVRHLIAEANTAQYEEHSCGKCQKDLLVAKNVTYPRRRVYCHNCYLKYLEQNG